MDKVSIIIPSRNESLLSKTVDDIYNKAVGEFEVIVILDGPVLTSFPHKHDNLIVINKPVAEGMRSAINDASDIATGKYLLKLDAHCMTQVGFDEILKDSCDNDWVVIARRYSLDPDLWERKPKIVDYYYLSCPWNNPKHFLMQSCPWFTKTNEKINVTIDDLMAFQGSMWFMTKDHFINRIGKLDTGECGDFAEHHEISMKTWLGGGRVIINKSVWYAHYHNRTNIRGYYLDLGQVYRDHIYSAKYWTENKWSKRIHDFDWLIDKFWPLPVLETSNKMEKYYWPEDWKELYDEALRHSI